MAKAVPRKTVSPKATKKELLKAKPLAKKAASSKSVVSQSLPQPKAQAKANASSFGVSPAKSSKTAGGKAAASRKKCPAQASRPPPPPPAPLHCVPGGRKRRAEPQEEALQPIRRRLDLEEGASQVVPGPRRRIRGKQSAPDWPPPGRPTAEAPAAAPETSPAPEPPRRRLRGKQPAHLDEERRAMGREEVLGRQAQEAAREVAEKMRLEEQRRREAKELAEFLERCDRELEQNYFDGDAAIWLLDNFGPVK